VQDKTSVDLLESIGISDNVHITGDTRYDRVTAISASLRPIEQAEKFKGNQRVLVCGSTWPTDEVLISKSVSALPQEWKIIIAPHEIDEKHILQIESTFSGITARFSMLDADASNYQKRILIIDNIGMLSSLYAYGNIAYVGGGFQKGGIHNTLEPAIFGLPVIIGPVYRKFVEAAELVNRKAAFVANDEVDLKKLLSVLASNDEQRDNVKRDLAKFMAEKTGAADRIIAQIEASKLL
jgi:3-deoxy-D-manno-octulosonic-acid transferase